MKKCLLLSYLVVAMSLFSLPVFSQTQAKQDTACISAWREITWISMPYWICF